MPTADAKPFRLTHWSGWEGGYYYFCGTGRRTAIQDVLASRPDEVTCARCLRLLVEEAEGRLSRLASTWFSKEAPWTDP